MWDFEWTMRVLNILLNIILNSILLKASCVGCRDLVTLYTVKDITAIEAVQRRYTKRLPGFGGLSYTERLKRLNLLNLELRRLHADLIYCYKIVFGLTTYHPVTFLRRPRCCLPWGTIISCTRTAAILLSVPRSLVNALSTRGICYQVMLISAHL